MNPTITKLPNNLPDCAEVYFHDGKTLGPMIAMMAVGDELAELILGTYDALADQGIKEPTFGTAGAMLVARAVYTGNHVSLNPAPPRVNFGSQISFMHQREYAPGGIGVVLIDVVGGLITTYGGRGFPEVQPCNPYTPTTITMAQLKLCRSSGVKQAPTPEKKKATRKLRTMSARKASKKKASKKTETKSVTLEI